MRQSMAHSMKRFQGIWDSSEKRASDAASAYAPVSLGTRKSASGGKVGGWTGMQWGIVANCVALAVTKWNIHLALEQVLQIHTHPHTDMQVFSFSTPCPSVYVKHVSISF